MYSQAMRTRLEHWRSIGAAVLLLACDRGTGSRGATAGSGVDPVGAAGTAASATPSGSLPLSSLGGRERWPSPPDGARQEFTAGIVAVRPAASGVALLTDVRAARHDGFDRVVFELGGGSPPGFHLEYIDKPVRKCGSGESTTIAGDAWLQVRLEPTNAHTENGAPTIADRKRSVDLEVVTELEQTCDFEAVVSWVLGVKRPNKYRVLTLNDPLRLVIDVQH